MALTISYQQKAFHANEGCNISNISPSPSQFVAEKEANNTLILKRYLSSMHDTPFRDHMSLQEAYQLQACNPGGDISGDWVNYRKRNGNYVRATVGEDDEDENERWLGFECNYRDFSINYKCELHKLSVFNSISKRPAHRFEELKVGCNIYVNPKQRMNMWLLACIEQKDDKTGQIQVSYRYNDKRLLYWTHLDNEQEIADTIDIQHIGKFICDDYDDDYDDDKFVWNMSNKDMNELEIGEPVDYRRDDGKYIVATIRSNDINKCRTVDADLYNEGKIESFEFTEKRIANFGSITHRGAHRLRELKINDVVFIKPFLTKIPRLGQVHHIFPDSDCAQIEVMYQDMNENKYCWVHPDNNDEIIKYGPYNYEMSKFMKGDLYNILKKEYTLNFCKKEEERKSVNISNRYNDNIVSQLVHLNVGTKLEIIQASKQCINPNDIFEVQQNVERMKGRQRQREIVSVTPTKTNLHISDIDELIGSYYVSMGINKYYEIKNEGIGRFEMWCIDNGYDTEMILEELEYGYDHEDIEECEIVEFDDEFPLNDKMKNNGKSKEENILNIILFCYKNGFCPRSNSSILDFNLESKPNDETKQKCLEIFKKGTNRVFHGEFICNDRYNYILDVMSIGYQDNNYNFFMYLIDSYLRDRICNESNPREWVLRNHEFKQINDNIKDSIISVFNSRTLYWKTPMVLCPTRLIDDDIKIICKYVAAFTQFINLYLIEKKRICTPFQIECIIAFGGTKSREMVLTNIGDDDDDDDDDGDDEDEDDYNKEDTDWIGNIRQRLGDCNCKYITDLIENEDIYYKIINCYNKFEKKVNYNLSQKRISILMDRRFIKYDDVQQIFMYEFPKNCRFIPDIATNETMIFLSKQCLIPGKLTKRKDEKIITSMDHCGGKMLTFSFHIESPSIIRCYLYWNASVLRFYPQDIGTVLPSLFYMKGNNFIASDESKRIENSMFIHDAEFEYFYNHLTNHKDMKFIINDNTTSWRYDYILVMGYIRNILTKQTFMIQDINNLIFKYYR